MFVPHLRVVFSVFLLALRFTHTSTTPLIETTLGAIQGKRVGSLDVFLGIPYAEPPIGRYRFRPTRPKLPWGPNILDAREYGPECLQSTLYTTSEEERQDIVMNEDCLFLNIWKPIVRQDSKTSNRKDHQSTVELLPVMVWIHGGAFIQGSSNRPEYEGSQLAQRNQRTIVVTLNYRLGALGFLVSTVDGLFGNYGLNDQIVAIQWVKDNIQSFGGDPNRITLFGESAGAMSVGLHLLDSVYQQQRVHSYDNGKVHRENIKGNDATDDMSNNNRDDDASLSHSDKGDVLALFHSIILQSNPFGYKFRSVSVANFIGESYRELLDCEDIKCLQSESPEELIHVQDTLMAVPRSIGDFFTWGPVVTDFAYYRETRIHKGPVANVTVLQPMDSLSILRRTSVPVILGNNANEGNVFVFTAYPTRMTKFIYQTLVFSFFRSSAPKILRMYESIAKPLSEQPYPDYRLVLSTIIGDYLFRCPNQYIATQIAKSGAKVFYYEFALPTRTPGYPCCDGLSCHTSEIPYVFHQYEVIESDYSWYEQDKSVIDNMSNNVSVGQRQSKPVSDILEHFRSNRHSIDSVTMDSEPDIFGAKPIQSERNLYDNNVEEIDSNELLELLQKRSEIDSDVSRLLSDYWTTFSSYGDPNGLIAKGTSGYIGTTAPVDAPYWPQLFGAFAHELPSFTSAVPTISIGATGTHNQNNIVGHTPMNKPFQMNRKGIDKFGTTGFGQHRFIHQMVFDDQSSVNIIEEDCICRQWDEIGYHF